MANTKVRRTNKGEPKKPKIVKAAAKSQTTIVSATAAPVTSAGSRPKNNKRHREPEEFQTPQSKRFRDAVPPTPSETPTRGASRLFDRLNLANTTTSNNSKEALAYSSPPLTPHHKCEATIPPAVDEVIQLFAAFHSAWSLFIAHNGNGTPMHIFEVVARVTSSWKKRRVTLQDIKLLLGVLGGNSPFVLIDNGDGDLCMDLKDEAALATILRSKQLVKDFEQRIRHLWAAWCSSEEVGDAKGETFLKSIPLATVCTSEVAADPLKVSKGQQRLTLLKENANVRMKEESSKKVGVVSQQSKSAAAVESRGAGLIDRILAKQQSALNNSSGPTRAQLERQSALDRIEEVALVLGLLAGGRPRASFSMQMLVQHLQNSMRNPIAREEAERSIELMAKEVCPRFVSLIRSGTLNGVVITRLGRPNGLELRTNVDQVRKRDQQ